MECYVGLQINHMPSFISLLVRSVAHYFPEHHGEHRLTIQKAGQSESTEARMQGFLVVLVMPYLLV